MNQDDELDPQASNDDDYDGDEFEGVYVIDDETADLLASAIGIVQMTAGMQLDEDARENLLVIADAIQERFAIEQSSMVVEEHVIVNPDTGEEEVLYKPKGGVFGDEPLEDPQDDDEQADDEQSQEEE